MDLLEEELEHSKIILLKLEKDLELAATIGQSLLVENQKLREASNDGLARRYETLEADHHDSMVLLDQKQAQVDSLTDALKALKDVIRSNEGEICDLNIEVAGLSEKLRINAASDLKSNSDKASLFKEIEELHGSVAHSDKIIAELRSRSSDFEELLQAKDIEVESFSERNKKILEEVQEGEEKVKELELLLETYQAYRETCDEQVLTLEQLSMDLDFANDANIKLSTRLSQLEPDYQGQETEGEGKNLFNEIEERRQELIKENESLVEKHAKSNTLSLFRQQKLKIHINRLSQLTSQDSSVQEKCRILEERLSQSESEKRELERRLKSNQSRQYYYEDGPTTNTTHEKSTSLMVSNLEFRIMNLIEECEGLKSSNQTIRLIKAGESDKLYQTTQLLLERDRELDSTKLHLANSRFELDELKLAQRISNLEATGIDEPDLEELKESVVEFDEAELSEGTINEDDTPVSILEKEVIEEKSSVKTVTIDRSQVQDCKQQ